MGCHSLLQVLELLQPGYPDNVVFFLGFYESEQAKKLRLKSEVHQKYGPGTVASREPCVIRSNTVNTASFSGPLLMAYTFKWLSTAVTCVCKHWRADIRQ